MIDMQQLIESTPMIFVSGFFLALLVSATVFVVVAIIQDLRLRHIVRIKLKDTDSERFSAMIADLLSSDYFLYYVKQYPKWMIRKGGDTDG